MREIALSQQGKYKGKHVAIVDDGDYDWLNQFRWYVYHGRNNIYALGTIRVNGKEVSIKMHRLILGLTDPKIVGDHIDHNGLNNQRSNLRVATLSQNGTNKRSRKNSSSKYLGVFRAIQKGRYAYWAASCGITGTNRSLGYFKTEIEAARAYDERAKILFGEFANLNFK